MKLSRSAVKHPVVLTMCLIALGFFGIVSLSDVNVEFMAKVNTPQVFVVSVYPGASTEDIEETVIDVMEDRFVTLQNFKSIQSTASNSVGMSIISFADDCDAYDMLTEVRAQIDDMMAELPDGLASKPVAVVGGTEMIPIMSFTVRGGEDLSRLTEYVNDELKPQITRLDGVSTVTVSGTADPRVDIVLRLDDLESKGISVLNVYQILSASNMSIPLGNAQYGGREISVRYDGSYDSIEEIKRLPVGSTEQGDIIRLSDVADIDFSIPKPDYYIQDSGDNVIYVEVCKRGDGNTLHIVSRIKDILAHEAEKSGNALSFGLIGDDSQIINSSLSTVIQSGLLGIVIAVLVIFIFLNDLKATLVIGLSIPLSIFFTFIGMKIAGQTVNLMTISGIVVCLGSIVDASIVVLDQIYKEYQSQKDGRYLWTVNQSIYRGTDTVDKSVFGSNFTTIVVFIPLAMLSGIVGMIIKPVSITFMIAIGSSLIVALLFVPYFMKKFLKEDGDKRKVAHESFVARGMTKLEKVYKRSVNYVLDHSAFFLIGCILLLVMTFYLFTQMGFAFIPSTDNNDFYIEVTFPYGQSLDETLAEMQKAENLVIERTPELKSHIMMAGKSNDMFSLGQASPTQGSMHCVLVPVSERDRDIHEVIRDLQYNLSAILPGATVVVKNGGFDNLVGFISDGGGFGLTLVGTDMETLYDEALRLEDFLKSDPEVVTVSINTSKDTEVAVLDASYEYLSSLGLTSMEAGMTTAVLFNGVDTGLFKDPSVDRSYDIHLSSDVANKPVNRELLSSIHLKSMAGGDISMDSIADFRNEQALSQINHTDRSKTITVSAQLTTESTTAVNNRVKRYLAENPLPDGISTMSGGMEALLQDSLVPMVGSGIIGVFLVYMIMVFVFERFKHPFLIMMTIPFCAVGVLLSLAAFGSSLNVISIMGVISLAGMIVNNGIIMIDYINQLMAQGRKAVLDGASVKYDPDDDTFGLISYDEEMMLLRESIKEGTSSRLRPILMSALTTILGVIPMAVATGEGAEIYAPLGQVIMGGLTTSTFITLFLMPILYYRSEKKRMKRFYKYHEVAKVGSGDVTVALTETTGNENEKTDKEIND